MPDSTYDLTYRNQILDVLRNVDIQKVYYIDDALQVPELPTAADIIASLNDSAPDGEQRETLQVILPKVPIGGPVEAVRIAVEEAISEVDDDNLKKIRDILKIETATNPSLQVQFLESVFENIGDIELHCVSPTEWESIETEVLASAQDSKRVLCLVDEILTSDNSVKTTLSASGMNIIRRIARTDNKESVLCVLFTSELRIETEVAFWREKAKDGTISSSKFFPLSKDRVYNSKHFAQGMQVSSLNLLYDVLKLRTISLLDTASRETKTSLDEIHVYNLNYMVAFTSHSEGIWEAKTLMRLYDVLHKEKVKRRIVLDNYATHFNENISKVKAISNILEMPEIESSERYSLRHQELYERPEWLNKAHTELNTGDIFKIKQPSNKFKEFVIVAQVCDITLRNTNGERRVAILTIAPIKDIQRSKYEEYQLDPSKKIYLDTTYILHHYRDETDNVGCVELNSVISIDASILDLAIFNNDGQCVIDLSQTVQAPEELPHAWKLRFSKLRGEFRSLVDRMRLVQRIADGINADDPGKEALKSAMYNPYAKISRSAALPLVTVDYSTDVIDWGIQRIGNLRPPIVNHLLDAYAHYMSRIAHDHNFSSLPTK
ncbi:MAG: hypothetical protein ACRYG7_07770 [Janthinobacterium lividum]